MSKGKKRYSPPNIQGQKKARIKNQEGKPTEPENLLGDLSFQPPSDYQGIARKPVPVESDGLAKLLRLVGPLSAAISIFVVIFGFVFWASNLQFDIKLADRRINENTSKIEKNSSIISRIELQNVGMEKDIEHLQSTQSRALAQIENLEKPRSTPKALGNSPSLEREESAQ